MFTSPILSDIHHRAHQTLEKLLAHCRQLTPEEFTRELDGFGYNTVRLQLHHQIDGEHYWVSVLQGVADVEEYDSDRVSIDTLEAFRQRTFAETESYLRDASPEELSTPRSMMTWGNKERVLVPAHVILRTVTHLFQHQGQVAAMCRLLGKPIPPGMDYPIISQ